MGATGELMLLCALSIAVKLRSTSTAQHVQWGSDYARGVGEQAGLERICQVRSVLNGAATTASDVTKRGCVVFDV